MKKISLLFLTFLLSGCARTDVKLKDFMYASSRDTDIVIKGVHVKPDGSIDIDEATIKGTASTIDQIHADVLKQAISKIPVPGVIPVP